MNPEQPKNQVESGWKTETEWHRDRTGRFLQDYLSTPDGQRKRYDPLIELHISGHNPTILPKIAEGTAKITRVNTFYEKGEPTQIHVVFDSEGKGHSMDAYLKGQALEDYLNEAV
jgi:hypothetical protein